MSEPRTEAGRAHEDYCRTFLGDDALVEILAIEAEARRDAIAAVRERVQRVGAYGSLHVYLILDILDSEAER